jgi:hypothetical protein
VTERKLYTTQLQAGLGLVDETKALIQVWSPGMPVAELYQVALQSGQFSTITARRLRNIVAECFAPRYLISDGGPAIHLKRLEPTLATPDLRQLMLIFTSRANLILGDFIRQVYWPRYAAGYTQIKNEDARAFVNRAIDDGRTVKRWSVATVRRVAGYLTGCCADYGLLERGRRSARQIVSTRISPVVFAYLLHDLHFAGVGDNALLVHEDWELFGLARQDVVEEIKRLSLKGLLLVQVAGELVRISWRKKNMEELCDALAKG